MPGPILLLLGKREEVETMYYLLKNTIVPCTEQEIGKGQFVAKLTTEEWKSRSERFDMGMSVSIPRRPNTWSVMRIAK